VAVAVAVGSWVEVAGVEVAEAVARHRCRHSARRTRLVRTRCKSSASCLWNQRRVPRPETRYCPCTLEFRPRSSPESCRQRCTARRHRFRQRCRRPQLQPIFQQYLRPRSTFPRRCPLRRQQRLRWTSGSTRSVCLRSCRSACCLGCYLVRAHRGPACGLLNTQQAELSDRMHTSASSSETPRGPRHVFMAARVGSVHRFGFRDTSLAKPSKPACAWRR
jgi:hypothetical protein